MKNIFFNGGTQNKGTVQNLEDPVGLHDSSGRLWRVWTLVLFSTCLVTHWKHNWQTPIGLSIIRARSPSPKDGARRKALQRKQSLEYQDRWERQC